MDKTKLHGLVTTFREDGSRLAETTYEQGVAHGPYRDYWSNGRLSLEGQYVHGSKDGEWRFFDLDGSLREVIRFERGREVVEGDCISDEMA
jgi:antitoxin component YwqK of YwqJK toxin-antitoxin module